MKRDSSLTGIGVRPSDPFTSLTDEQLAYIGGVALLYNDVEDQVDQLCAEGLRIPIYEAEVLSRINGIEGKIELIKIAAKHWGFDEGESAFLADSLGKSGFMLLKKWRDAVVHARLLDWRRSVAVVPERRGRFAEVLLSIDALTGLYARLAWMQAELSALLKILERRSRLSRGGIDEQQRMKLTEANRSAWVAVEEHRRSRLALPPMPEFDA